LVVKKAGAFHDDIDTQLTPGNVGRVTLCEYTDLVAIDDHVVTLNHYGTGKFAVRRVVASEMRIRFRITQIIDGNDLDIILLAAFVVSTQYIAPDAAVAIDRNFDGHRDLLSDYYW